MDPSQPYQHQPTTRQQQNTMVIHQAPGQVGQAAPQNVQHFSSGIFGCFEDCGSLFLCCCAHTSMYAYFFFECFLCSMATRQSESCCVPIFLQGGLMAMRTKLRVMYGIKGSICDDWCYTTFCPQLAACQMDREYRHVGV